jgi:flagellar biosynthesis activator protein FlaF
MPANPLDAYRNVEKATLLQAVKENWSRDDRSAELEDALNYNQKVWTFFQAELSMEDNPLPEEIKRNLLALSMFVDRRTFEALAYPAPEKLDILININLNVSAGLRGEA